MKKTLSIVLILSMVFTFFSCGAGKASPEDLNPTLTLDAFLKALKAGDLDTLQLYYEGDAKDLSPEEQIDDPLIKDLADQMMEKILDFEYALDNEKINGSSATVDMLIKTYDFEAIIREIINKAVSNAINISFLNPDPDAMMDNIGQLISEAYSDIMEKANKDKEITVPVKLVKKGGKWMVKDINKADDFIYALSGGLSKAAKSLENMIG